MVMPSQDLETTRQFAPAGAALRTPAPKANSADAMGESDDDEESQEEDSNESKTDLSQTSIVWSDDGDLHDF